MTLLRTLMLMALVIWVGGIIFFAFALAPTVFQVLPSQELAGNVVSRSLTILHIMGATAGVIFLSSSILYSLARFARPKLFAPVNVFVALMVIFTLVSQFSISSRMRALRDEAGAISTLPVTDDRGAEFDRLHHWSTCTESAVLLLGVGAVILTARRFS